jgi:hypothetical protein
MLNGVSDERKTFEGRRCRYIYLERDVLPIAAIGAISYGTYKST